jgi:hypothetical protein
LSLPTPSAGLPFRILIPTTQLSFLDFLYPQLQVLEIEGAGSFSDSHWMPSFSYGQFKGILTGRAEVSWHATGLAYTVQLNDVLMDMRRVTTVADAVLDRVVFYERVIAHDRGTINDVTLEFEKGNVHPQVMRGMVIGTPTFPMQAVYQFLVNLKQNIKSSLPKSLRRHWKPGYLILTKARPPWIMFDKYLMESIRQQRFPKSLLVTEIAHNWGLRDFQSLLGLRRVHVR